MRLRGKGASTSIYGMDDVATGKKDVLRYCFGLARFGSEELRYVYKDC